MLLNLFFKKVYKRQNYTGTEEKKMKQKHIQKQFQVQIYNADRYTVRDLGVLLQKEFEEEEGGLITVTYISDPHIYVFKSIKCLD